MTLFMAVAQSERFMTAYRAPLGLPASLILAVALVAPFAGGILLSQVEDVDY
jgi:hypothetical protein